MAHGISKMEIWVVTTLHRGKRMAAGDRIDNPIYHPIAVCSQARPVRSREPSPLELSAFTEAAGKALTCFPAGTLILTAPELVATETLRPGDLVLSTNPETGERAEKPVLQTCLRKVDRLIRLLIKGEELLTTKTHPFYVRDRALWRPGPYRKGKSGNGPCAITFCKNHKNPKSVSLCKDQIHSICFYQDSFS